MNIKYIANNSIKVILSKDELNEYNITFDKLNQNDYETKELILKIIKSLSLDENINLTLTKLYIEAFLRKNGDCVLYISIIDKSEENKDIYIEFFCKITSIENLYPLSYNLFQAYSYLIKESILYKCDSLYILKLKTYNKMQKKLVNILTEFAEIIGYNKIVNAYITEHSEILIKNSAIENILKLTS